MHSLTYRIKTMAPVIISAISGDRNMVRTKQYIPSTAFLGLLAKQIIKKKLLGNGAHHDEDFYAWFLHGKLKIGNAYILSWDEYDEYRRNLPTPFSIEKEKHGIAVYDGLFSDMDETKYLDGYCHLDGDSIQIQPVETQIEFHHARNRETGTSEKEKIFNYESIAPDQIFEGEIRGDKDDLERLLRFTGKQWTASLGRSRNAQYGTVEFRFMNDEPREEKFKIQQTEDKISMTLLSDLILYNDFGFPIVDMDALEKELQMKIGDIKIEKAFVKKNQVENFVSVWRLKKPSENCFKAGSVFLLKINSNDLNKLEEIQTDGIGERRHEGFGRVAFGLQRYGELSHMDEARPPVKKPDFPLPDTTQKIVKNIIEDSLIESIKLKAVEQQEEFLRLPSNSLISRLYAMADNSKGILATFIGEIKNFRKIADDQIQHCVSRNYNLKEFLISVNPVEDFLIQPRRKNLQRLIQEIDYDLNSDEALKNKLIHAYCATFFSMMRKRKIVEEKKNV